jgi:hypothetical protein
MDGWRGKDGLSIAPNKRSGVGGLRLSRQEKNPVTYYEAKKGFEHEGGSIVQRGGFFIFYFIMCQFFFFF